MALSQDITCDVLVIGSGAGGLSTAVTAKKHGLDVVVIEKDDVFGGTTAFSGGVLWIPGNGRAQTDARESRDRAKEYLKSETGNFFQDDMIEAFLDTGPKMLDWFENETEVRFVPTMYPDYHPTAPGGVDVGRSVLAAPFDSSELGPELKRLRPPLSTITFVGMMFNSSNADLKHFFKATKSITSALYVAKRLGIHAVELARYGRGVQVTSGNALAARLARSCFKLGIPIHTGTPAESLIREGEAVTGAVVKGANGPVRISARRGVVLACGGFPHDRARTTEAYPHLKRGGEHLSPVPAANTGDGIKLAETAGAQMEIRYPSAAAWMPVSKVPNGKGGFTAFPHLLDRYKPGIIAVLKNGKRFCNEAESYHDVGAAMIAACDGEKETAAWLIADKETMGKYGLGYAKPAPLPLGPLLKNGYLKKGETLAALAQACGIDAAALEATVAEYNRGAANGRDEQFGRGETAFNRYLADPEVKPNPCVGPVAKGPFYAVKLVMGDLGTFDGLKTTVQGQVLDADEQPISGLYAVGNDRASIMGGNYPGAGITLGPIMTFGFITGRHLAEAA
ncbi:succinate dehydrogenase/fumarate reductase flavoprotein subunit [Amaricoccus macauensis]|uniref:Succinate dehydrogenase/fumarate reductase flavoprotein subunit n=1 Tax=Amaricoccus macauensis TaxID=57001 RepID=A0A840SWU2_9RHOB|nr:FAD-dependent oxidoreductase [Amaricoccus macauensis]MBB5223572.1 succinate dehydrogenase/fumarate reductase flavoprotein subunit [Amaricoccus macauensis]